MKFKSIFARAKPDSGSVQRPDCRSLVSLTSIAPAPDGRVAKFYKCPICDATVMTTVIDDSTAQPKPSWANCSLTPPK